jgi:hypothetical protein
MRRRTSRSRSRWSASRRNRFLARVPIWERADDSETQEFDPGALIDTAEEGIDSNR